MDVFKAMCHKIDYYVEKLSEVGYFMMADLTPWIWVWPKVVIGYFMYFTTDAGSDSFIWPVLLVSVETVNRSQTFCKRFMYQFSFGFDWQISVQHKQFDYLLDWRCRGVCHVDIQFQICRLHDFVGHWSICGFTLYNE